MATKRAVYEIADYKAAQDRPGEFTALVSVFGNVDLQGDRVMPGAFKKSLDRWKSAGDPIPVIWSHAWDDPFAHIGYVTKATEVAGGLQIVGKNDVDKPFASQVHDLMTSRRVTGMSFAYDVINEQRAKDGANELTELDLIEVGPTLKGANPDAQLVGAKALLDAAAAKEEEADGTKAGRRLSQATQDEMQSIHDDLTALQERMRTLMGTASDEPKNESEADSKEAPLADIEADETADDREPEAKSYDAETLQLRSRIAEMRATLRKQDGTDSP